MTLILDDKNFDNEVLRSDLPVLVDFWGEHCGPCKMIAPAIDQLAEEFKGRAKVGKVNVGDNPLTMSRYGIRGVPTLLIFQAGQVREHLVGGQPKDKIIAALSKYAKV